MELKHLYSNETKSYEIDNYERVKADYKEWLEKNIHTGVDIIDEDTYKAIYKERTLLNKEIEALKNDKKIINNIVVGRINNECEELIDLLKEVLNKLNENMEAFKPKEAVYEYKFKTKNKELYDKIVAFIEETLKGE